MIEKSAQDSRIRTCLILFIAGLIVSGVTAFPLEAELKFLYNTSLSSGLPDGFVKWIGFIYDGVKTTNVQYPFLAYGTDWLAFAHLVLAVLFIGPLRDPIKNIWVIEFGMIACVMVFPMAFIAGAARGIPLFWRLVDCSFGVVGGALLWYVYNRINKTIKTTGFVVERN